MEYPKNKTFQKGCACLSSINSKPTRMNFNTEKTMIHNHAIVEN
jgi:hypothetical protein